MLDATFSVAFLAFWGWICLTESQNRARIIMSAPRLKKSLQMSAF